MNNICMFCKQNCKTCTTSQDCTSCYPGYTNINNSCIVNVYQAESTWLNYAVDSDYQYSSVGDPLMFGFTLLPNDSSVTYQIVNCASVSSNKMISYQSNGNYSLNLVRTYFGLPFHQWAHFTIKYVTIDSWTGQTIQF